MTIAQPDDFESVIEPHEYYAHLMAGPHRRRVAQVGVPALTRHVVFWNPVDWASYNPEKKPSRARARGIDRAICRVYRSLLALQRRGIVSDIQTNGVLIGESRAVLFDSYMRIKDGQRIEREQNKENTGADAHRTVRFTFEWHRIKATLYFENHVEFVTATAILDLSRFLGPRAIANRKKDPMFALLHAHLESIATGAVDESRNGAIHRGLYRDVWHAFEREVLPRRRRMRLDTAIADFRGLILGVNYDLRKENSRVAPGQTVIAKPFTRKPAKAAENISKTYNPKWPRDEFRGIWDVLNGGINSEDTEITASQFLGKRAFYATSLGDQSGLDSNPDPDPVFYLIYENTTNMWQLGRLIYRINWAGTLRILATMHFEKLREVGGGLLRAGSALDLALSRPAAQDQGDEESVKKMRKQVRDDYEKVEEPMRPFVDIKVDGPIYERIERSRHYAGQFRQLVGALRIQRIEGFQPYDEFVYQKLGPVFEYIDRLGRRYAQVQRDRALLFRRLQALDALYGERVISEAQYIADVALFGVLGPYYVGSLLVRVIHTAYDQRLVWIAMAAFGIASVVPITVLRLLDRIPYWRADIVRWMLAKGWLKSPRKGQRPTWQQRVWRGFQIGLGRLTRASDVILIRRVMVAIVRTRIGRVVLAGAIAALFVVAAQKPWWPRNLSPTYTDAVQGEEH